VRSEVEAQSVAAARSPDWLDPDLRWAETLWHARKGVADLPTKSQIDPLDVPPRCLDLAFLFELRDDAWYARLIGTGYFALYGYDVTGMRVSDFIRATGTGPRVLADYERARSSRLPVFSQSVLNWRPTGAQLPYHRVVLPFTGNPPDDGMVRYLFGFTKLLGNRF